VEGGKLAKKFKDPMGNAIELHHLTARAYTRPLFGST
jgi:hypothetical protein